MISEMKGGVLLFVVVREGFCEMNRICRGGNDIEAFSVGVPYQYYWKVC